MRSAFSASYNSHKADIGNSQLMLEVVMANKSIAKDIKDKTKKAIDSIDVGGEVNKVKNSAVAVKDKALEKA